MAYMLGLVSSTMTVCMLERQRAQWLLSRQSMLQQLFIWHQKPVSSLEQYQYSAYPRRLKSWESDAHREWQQQR